MSYIDGFVAAVPTDKKAEYLAFVKSSNEVFKEYGAISMGDGWGDDVPEGKVNSLHTAVLRKEGETVVLSWIIWPSKEVRNAAYEKIMEDPRMQGASMPFDGQRMIYGGFEPIES